MVAMLAFMALLAGGLFYLFLRIDFLPNPASQERVLIDHLLQVLLAIASVFFAIIITVFGYALLFFRGQPGDETDSKPIQGSAPLEIAWTVIPLIIVICLSIYGANVLDQMTAASPNETSTQTIFSLGAFVPRTVPASGAAATSNATAQPELVVNVDAQRFVWSFSYPQYSVNTTYLLEVPVNRRIVFHISSEDVIHSFWVQAWGPKQDAVPGLSPDLRITPTKLGQFTVECNQLCGYGHSDMMAPVRVVSEADFNTWVQQQAGGATAAPPPGTVSYIDLSAKNIAFDTSTITVAAGSEVAIRFANNDTGIPHNFSVYTDSSARTSIFIGQIITGPGTITYTFTAPTTPGSYYFQCDVHPTLMNGTFVVK
jgi:heme/copper-type cytochrome/quinol oxidase subunit 2